jgi:antitoxin VapB
VRAKLFTHGGSQAVRLPKAFRFEGKEVSIRKEGDSVILEPLRSDRPRDWPAYWSRLDAFIEGECPDRADEGMEQ